MPTMTSRERVLTTFAHREPDRVPAWCGSSDEFWAKAKRELNLDDEGLLVRFGDDFRRVHSRYAGPTFTLPPGVHTRTVFGIDRHGLGYGHAMNSPLADASLDEIHAYAWPDPRWHDVSHLRDDALRYRGQYAILGGDWSPFWHDAIDLVGMENLYLMMYDRPDAVHAIFQHIVDYYVASNERILDAANGAIDILFIGNDLGSQTGPLLGVDLFREFLQPHLKRLIDVGHRHGTKVMLHCCGGIAPLIPSLIEIGLDALHAIQPDCVGMDLRTLKSRFGDAIVFNGAIDSHHILITGTPDLVREKTRDVLSIMSPHGGYIAGASHDSILEETPVENIVKMFDTIRDFRLR